MASVPRRRPTIADVAALAGVSKGAVSRALNGGAGISAPTIARIQAAAAELDWVPNSAARAVSGAASQAVGLVLRRNPELLEADPFFPAFIAGVEQVLSAAGQSAVIRFVSEAGAEHDAYRRLFSERRVDGFLVTDLRHHDPRFEWLRALEAPAVVAGTPPRTCTLPSVGTGSADQVRELLRHLIDAGHRTIAHVSGPPSLRHARRRIDLWRQTLEEAGLEPGPLADGEFTSEGSVRATRELLEAPNRPTAIFYASDVMAIAGMSAIAEAGLSVPDDVAVAGFDGIALSNYVVPSLTTVHCDYQLMGRRATQMLLTLVRGEEVPHISTPVGAQLVVRRSTTRTP
ncbi:LacI family transcriptional regulator [Herbiconiux moechotypicola]|uniref:LacI family DNA-binding transcriptional regulator n=1 Tax=Herbiconiux moechotypicola TaxID=637393 RepID=A0ABN3DHF2_9MICO|nr:LacI family DNA-binding transcriptional regulator [Herbiconiux moechotypicola]MCS5729599.1 LacI family transcriptional regulator [Herbiconiux moechotypicola]